MAYNFDKKEQVGDWLVEVDTVAQYGYFENQEHGGEGGLWFTNNELVDYDGVYEIPKQVIMALQSMNLNVDYVLED
jgi:hypothetical protein